MITVLSTRKDAIDSVELYESHVNLAGSRAEIVCEIKALIHSFLDDPELEDIYLSISTEIAKAHIEDLERTLRRLKDD